MCYLYSCMRLHVRSQCELWYPIFHYCEIHIVPGTVILKETFFSKLNMFHVFRFIIIIKYFILNVLFIFMYEATCKITM